MRPDENIPAAMQALRLTATRRFELVETPVPEINRGQALIRFRYGLLCGSDAVRYRGGRDDYSAPLPVGMPIHECVGRVARSEIPGLLPGTDVLAMPDDSRGLGDYFVASRTRIAPLHGWEEDELPVAVLAQPLATVLAGIDRLGSVRGETALVIGLGTMGMLACMLLRGLGVREVTAIEPNAFRAGLAEELFQVHTIAQFTADLENSAGIVIEAVGQQHHQETIPNCLVAVRQRGSILFFGLPVDPQAAIPIKPLIRKNLRILGSIAPDWEAYLPDGVREAYKNRAKLRRFITQEYTWQEAGVAFELFLTPNAPRLKILLSRSCSSPDVDVTLSHAGDGKEQ